MRILEQGDINPGRDTGRTGYGFRNAGGYHNRRSHCRNETQQTTLFYREKEVNSHKRDESNDFCKKATQFAELGNLVDAMEAASQAIGSDGQNPEAWRQMFRILMGLGNFDQAVQVMQCFLSLEPKNAGA